MDYNNHYAVKRWLLLAAFSSFIPLCCLAVTGNPTVSNAVNADGRAEISARVLSTFVVSNTNDSGAGSLRQAILDANASPGTDNITFNIPGFVPHIINLNSALPVITEAVVIDGTSEPDFSSSPVIALVDGVGAISNGLVIGATGGGSTISALSIQNFQSDGILLQGSNNTIIGNYLGLQADGNTIAGNNQSAAGFHGNIRIESANNIIGGILAADRNVISGSGFDGIVIIGTSANGNKVLGNYIGTDATGALDRGNAQEGIEIDSADNNTIGGIIAGSRNIISGNGSDGIEIDNGDNNIIQGNYIGTDVTGTVALGNDRDGIDLNENIGGGAENNLIGGTDPNAGNIISGNGINGIEVREAATNGNTIQGNYIGTDVNGTATNLGNASHGIWVSEGNSNIIGGTNSGEPNVIAFNGDAALEYGIYISAATSISNLISGNKIYENFDAGIKLDGAGANNDKLVPTIISVIASGSDYTAIATVENNDVIEFFRVNNSGSPVVTADGSGAGEGYLFLGSCVDNGACSGPHINAVADANAALGTVEATLLSSGIFLGNDVTATATDGANNTSEFAANITAVSLFVVLTSADSGPGSLRQTILNANASPGIDNITFNIPGPGPHTIQPLSVLPTITDPVVIDGTTQPGAQCNTVAAPGVSDAVLLIVLDGSMAGAGVNGLTITAGSSTIRGLVINRFDNNGIELNSNDNVIECNYVGTDTSGTVDLGNNDEGVQMSAGASNNTIGGTTPQARNLVSGNGGDGVIVRGSASTGNLIIGNFIGTDVTGTLALGNDGDGIHFYSGANGNTIGSTAAGYGNLISANNINGVHLNDPSTSGNQVLGNLIGTDINGTADLGNTEHGIFLENSADGNTIGGTVAGSRNIISGNDMDGVYADGVDNLIIQGNYIGTDITGTLDLGNSQNGVDFDNTTNSTIGGTTVDARNIISGNDDDGVRINGSGSTGNLILGNYIGTNAAGTAALGNGLDGVKLDGASNSNSIGGPGVGQGNLISGNDKVGVVLLSPGNVIQGNLIGTTWTGGGSIPNLGEGVRIRAGADGNLVGGPGLNEGNVIANNGGEGIVLEALAGTGNSLLSNSVHSNGKLGIDLEGDDVTPNDLGDGDPGPNELLNFPVIISITQVGPNLDVEFELDVPAGNYRIEFFDNPSGVDPSDHGEGEVFLDFTTVAGSPASTHSVNLTGVTPSSVMVVTTTATEDLGGGNYGNTSEFSSVNTSPIAVDDNFNTNEDTPLSDDVVTNDSDPNGDPLTVSLITDVINGNLILNPDGTFTYTPDPNYHGGDSFVYEVCDDAAPTNNCAQATVNITVNSINDLPLAVDDPGETTNEDVPVVNSVLTNDSDPDGDPLTIISLTQPANGTTVNNGNGTITYTPFPNFSGVNTYTYTIHDGNGGTSTATVTVTVNGFNDPPNANLDIFATLEDIPITFDVLANDLDVDGDPISISSFTLPTNGNLVQNPDDTFTYTPDPDYNGIDSFTYTISDGNGGSDNTTVTLVVAAINDAPVAVNDTTITNEEQTITLNVITNDTDMEGDPLQVVIVTQGGNGSVTNNNDGTVTYVPFPNYNGTDSFTYTITDGNGGISTASVAVTIVSTNDAPVAVDDFANTLEDTQVLIVVLANDFDVDGDVVRVTSVTQPPNGLVNVRIDGSIRYDPDVNFTGTDTFTYTITDGNGLFDTGMVTVVIGPINDNPIARDDMDITLEDKKVNTNVLANDDDPENKPLVIVSVTQGSNGTVINNGNGTISYTPNPNYSGLDTYTYTVSDGQGGTATATVTITVLPINDPPVAVLDIASTNEDIPVTTDVLANDYDIDGDPLTIVGETQGTNGTVVNNGDGTITYTPNTNFVGIDTYTYTISDGQGEVATAVVTIWVGIINDPPVAIDDIANTTEDLPVTTDVLANDGDPDMDTLTVVIVTDPSFGTIADNGDGTITYTPLPNFSGTDTYTYTITDGNGGTDTAIVTVIVDNANDDPIAIDDFDGTNEDFPVTTDVLVNDVDPEGDVISITSVTQPSNGAAVDNGDGTITYAPDANFNGNDTYTYNITDGNGGSATATVTIFVNPLQDPPTAVDDIFSTPMDVPLTGNVLANDFDVEGDVLTIINLVSGANGSTVDNGDGTVTYTPNSGFVGVDVFTYTITDGNGFTSSATVTVYVGISNNPPSALDDSETTDEDMPVTTDVLANDSDPDVDPLSIVFVTQPANGSATDNGDGTVTYTPDPDFNGSDSYTYTITDGKGGISTATVTVTVNPINDPPVANDDFENTNEDTPVILAVLVNDRDVDGDVLSIIGFSQGTNGTVTDNGDGTLTYQPNPNFSGTDTFTYVAGEGNGGADMATVTIILGAVNDSPIAVDDTDTTDEDVAVTTDVLVNDSDPEGDPISIISLTQSLNGTVVDNGDGTITYTPDANFNGTDTYTYTITDGNGGLSSGLVTITVNPINDPPLAIDDLGNTTDEDTTIDISVVINDSDLDGTLDLNSITIISAPVNGSLVDNGDGTLTYTPDPDYNGPDAFSYTVRDNDGAVSNVANVQINIRDVNDPPIALNDTTITSEETAVVINVAANDSDIDGTIDVTTVGRATSPSNGIVVVNGDGTVTYTPDSNFVGLDSLTYTIDDNDGATSNVATVYITVTNINDDPIAVNDSTGTNEDITLVLTAPGVLANDSDPDGDPLSVTGHDALSTQGGTVVVNIDGSVNYAPATNFTGTDTFTYTISDGNGGTSTATVTITVLNVNDPPAALNDTTSTMEETAIIVNVVANDSDIDGTIDVTSVGIISPPTNGTAIINGDGTITYTPNPNFVGVDSLNYTVNDNDGSTSNVATVIINVNNVNDPPIAIDDSFTTDEDTPLNIVAPGLLGNDVDIDGNTLTVTGFDNPSASGGVVLVNGDGSFTYTPPMDFNGTDSFTYTIDDGNGGTDVATVTIVVNPINDNPTAADDSYSTNENTLLVVAAPGVLGNDSDIDGDTFTITNFDTNSVNGGVIVVNADGSFDYTPPAGFVGSDTFTYVIDDGNGGTDTATVTITVININDPPDAMDDNYLVDEDLVLSVTDPILGLLNNDSDPEGDNLSVSTIPVAAPLNGTLLLNPDGTFTYTPNPNFNGIDNFVYEVCDDGVPSLCIQATVTINVNSQQDPPTAVNDSLIAILDIPLNVPAPGILANDSDVDGDVISVIALNAVQSSGGTLIWNADGSFDYTPPAGFTGVEIFEYTISDGNGGTDIAELTLSVLPVNNAPIAEDDMYTTEEDLSVSGNVLDNDSDPEGQNLTVNNTPVSAPMSGSVTINTDGTFTYTPNPGFSGIDSFTYEVCDDGIPSQCAQATVMVEVTPFEGLIIYQGVSPNNDGSNDIWTIQGIERYPNNYVQIFNRWGSKIYQARGYNNVTVFWEGQSTEGIIVGDKVAPDGTYFYVLNLGDGSELYSGYIVLKK